MCSPMFLPGDPVTGITLFVSSRVFYVAVPPAHILCRRPTIPSTSFSRSVSDSKLVSGQDQIDPSLTCLDNESQCRISSAGSYAPVWSRGQEPFAPDASTVFGHVPSYRSCLTRYTVREIVHLRDTNTQCLCL